MAPPIKSWKADAALAAVEALVEAGVLPAADRDRALSAVTAALPAPPGGAYSFSSDAEFLLHSLSHHVQTYFKQVMEPLAKIHHAKNQTGRLMRDEEIVNAATELTTQIFRELGREYTQHMYRYFGDEEGLIAYVFNRVQDMLLNEAIRYNDRYLAGVSRRVALSQMGAAEKAEPQA